MARIKYRVKPNDNLLELAERFNTTPAQIRQQNQINNLTPGQTLNIPNTGLRPVNMVRAGMTTLQQANVRSNYQTLPQGQLPQVNAGQVYRNAALESGNTTAGAIASSPFFSGQGFRNSVPGQPIPPAQPRPLTAYEIYQANIASQALKDATAGATPPGVDPAAVFGRYAEGDKLYSGQAKTAQEAFKEGTYKPGKRWWIRKDPKWQKKSEVAAPQITTPFVNQVAANALTWRVG